MTVSTESGSLMGRRSTNRRSPMGLPSGLSRAAGFASDLAITFGAFFAASQLVEGPPAWALPQPVPIMALFMAGLLGIVMVVTGAAKRSWRFSTPDDLFAVTGSILLAHAVAAPALYYMNQGWRESLSTLAVAGSFASVGALVARMAASKLFSGELTAALTGKSSDAPAGLVFGETAACIDVINRARAVRPNAFRPIGVILTDRRMAATTLCGAPVLGEAADLEATLARLRADGDEKVRLVLADPAYNRESVSLALAAAGRTGAVVRRLAQGAGRLADVEPSDLLARPPRRLDMSRPRRLLQGRRVLVTGAGGTIGSELSRQILACEPAELILMDASEFNLYEIELKLKEMGAPEAQRRAVLGDVRDPFRVRQIFERFKPEVVLHAAALKHVPLMETNSTEAVLTNILGTEIIAEACVHHDVEAFVLISTDKAVKPMNVMGSTKRAAELVVRRIAQNARGHYSIVRFGNVLGSAGSVAPLFERQIAAGGPVTVTHKDMKRYFMTVEEAGALVLQAAALERDPHAGAMLFVLDMGEPVRIDDLARQVIWLKGMEPDRDIAIEYTGLRPGEKLSEEIYYNDEISAPSPVEGLMMTNLPESEPQRAAPIIAQAINAARQRDTAAAKACLAQLTPTLNGS